MTDRTGRSNRAWTVLAQLVTRRPRAVLVVWLATVGVLALAGIGLERRLSTPPIYVHGTTAAREHELAVRAFGDDDALVVMLRGPSAAVERQGRQLDRALDALPRTRVVSPWHSDGSLRGLRPSPRTAVVIVSVTRTVGQQYTDIVAPVRRTLAQVVRAPARADLSGSPAIAAAMRDAAFHAAAVGERIALPILLLVLLLVFRSVLAAAIPAIIGGATVLASHGVLSLLTGTVQLDALATGLAAMMSLGLGVDYSLLVVSRFREELPRSGDVVTAVRTAVTTTGRTVLLAGTALLLTMLVAAQLLPGAIIVSAAVAIVAASVLSVAAALLVVPALLTVSGAQLERWSLPRRAAAGEPWAARWSRRLTRRPVLATNLILVVLIAGTLLAFTLNTGAASVGLLPPHDPARLQAEAVDRTLGPGWGGPLEVLVDGRERMITEPGRLLAIAHFERDVARDPGVATLAGLRRIAIGLLPLRQLPVHFRSLTRGTHALARLDRGVESAHARAGRVSGSLATAAADAVRLAAATDASTRGAGELARRLHASASGSTRWLSGVSAAAPGGRRLAQATARAHASVRRLQQGLAHASEAAGSVPDSAQVLRNGMAAGSRQLADAQASVHSAETQLAAAWQALRHMEAGRSDPRYQAALGAVGAASAIVSGVDPASGEPAASGVKAAVADAAGQFDLGRSLGTRMRRSATAARAGLDRLASGAASLDQSLARVATGSGRLGAALGRLRRGSDQLAPGLQRLTQDADSLKSRIGQLQAGTARLAHGLGAGASNSGTLADGLARLGNSVKQQQVALKESALSLEQLRARSPNLFRSGYLPLASIDGASPRRRDQAGLVLNVDRGGHAARLLVIPTTGPLSAATRRTQARLQRRADVLARQTGSQVLVAGPAATLQDYDAAVRSRVPLVVLALALTGALVLTPVIRSLVLPLVAALLNVLTVGATFGLLSLLFGHSLLGGPGYIDTIGLGTIVTVAFGLSIDYEVFVLARVREEFVHTGSTDCAVTNGVAHTARVVTGAAAIMIAVFCAFAVSPFASIRNFGAGLAIAVFLDAFLVRLVAFPAVMRMLGARCWWLPQWLEQLLPGQRHDDARSAAFR